MYQEIDKSELIKGIKTWKNKNGFTILMVHYTADPNKDPERDGKEWYENERMGTTKALWKKEYEIDSTTKAGQLVFSKEYCDFDADIHFINSFEIQEPYELLMSLDFGQRNPTAALVGIWTDYNTLYIVDEYYKPALPSQSSKEMFRKFAYLMGGEDNFKDKSFSQKRDIANTFFQLKTIDPSTGAKNRSKVIQGEEIPYSIIEEFYDNGWEFETANNEINAGINRIREYFQIDQNKKARLYIFKDKCPNLCLELKNYRYRELTEIQIRTKNKSEEPIKKDDHAIDALRYMIMTRPYAPQKQELPKTRIQRDIENLIRPRVINTWDIDN